MTRSDHPEMFVRNAIYRDALRLIAGLSCENNHSGIGACIADKGRMRDADYGADAWCSSCIAYDALKRGRDVHTADF